MHTDTHDSFTAHHCALLQVRTWPPGMFSMPQLMEAVGSRMKRPGGESKELALLLAELYERQVWVWVASTVRRLWLRMWENYHMLACIAQSACTHLPHLHSTACNNLSHLHSTA